MIKDYRILLVLALAGFVFFAISLAKQMQPEYVKHQKAYYKQLKVDDAVVEIRQVNVKAQGGIIVDRCQSCHIGASNPDAAGFDPPLAMHPPIVEGIEKDPHDFGKIGCAVCHDGNARALEKHDAHGQYHGWPHPLLAGKSAQASCNRCHAMESGSLAGAEVYEKGRELFLEKACWGCHTIAGISTTSQAPELTDAGGKFTYDYLIESIVEPSANISNSKMPTFDWIHDTETVEALATYLKGQQKNRLRSGDSAPIGYVPPASIEKRIEKPSVEAGRTLFAGEAYEGSISRGGCINCHGFRNSDGTLAGGTIGPELTWSMRSRGREYVKQHILNSRSHVADSIMPSFKDYNDAELESLVSYLSTFDYKVVSDDGLKLYDTYCISCHGENLDGRGKVSAMLDPLPRNLSRYQFVASYESRFKDSIRNGVTGTAMPAWKNILTDREIETLIDFIAKKSLANAPETFTRIEVELPKPGDPERLDYKERGRVLEAGDPERGSEAYQANCTACHGKLGNGKGPNAYLLEHPLPRNLLNKAFFNQAYVTDERLYQSILLGVAGTPMPAHDHLRDQTILDIIAFIRANTSEEPKK